MTPDYRTYLAANVLNEDRVITYRLLSRALKVHVNVAKEMLFEFHRQQNGRKPGTVYATYVVAGNRRRTDLDVTGSNIGRGTGITKGGEDTPMQSSPFQSSPLVQAEDSTEYTPILSLTLVREENVEELRSHYELIVSIHVYSLSTFPFKDLQMLSDSVRDIQDTHASEDPSESHLQYGTISNKGVRRRTSRQAPPEKLIATAPPKTILTSSKPVDPMKENQMAPTSKEDVPSSQPAKSSQSAAAKAFFAKGKARKTAPVSSAPANRDPARIFKSFAKAVPKLKREETDSSAGQSAVSSGAEDSPMKDVSDDEEEAYLVLPPTSNELAESDRKSRKEREAELRKMMEEDDDDEVVMDGAEAEVDRQPVLEESKETVEVCGSRRRGKRRVMKKKTVKDEEGYLVTKEETVWESFSEEELATPKSKVALLASSTGGKVKKVATKPGQGSIMSFFGKK